MHIRKTIAAAVIAGATALSGLAIAPTAHADGDCGAPWNNVGSPGNLYINSYRTYVGQVEQQYQHCSSTVTNVRAHFQWSGTFQQTNAGATIHVSVFSPYYGQAGDQYLDTNTKDVYSWPGIEIHHANPDRWEAQAILVPCRLVNSAAESTYWDYGTGSPYGIPVQSSC
ncbi:hypothetical protein [Kitasatospora sp. NPDC059803]|uniref:hypothetical protein n=1 Tax=Kitasatospora sp. NPDC059803 TaxID=3346953 RepID=UPI003647FFF6